MTTIIAQDSFTEDSFRVRVVPGRLGGWQVEDAGATQAVCSTLNEAEALAEQLMQQAGGGEVLVYDAYLRVRSAKQLPRRRPRPSG